jgi:hypothetical protein
MFGFPNKEIDHGIGDGPQYMIVESLLDEERY